MAIKFNNITDTEKHDAADMLLKIEAIEGALADIQTERATLEIEYTAKEQTLLGEKNKLKQHIRNIRTVEIV